jgi:plastocyanin
MEDRRSACALVGRMPLGWLAGAICLLLVAACGGGEDSMDASTTAASRVRDGMAGLQGGADIGMPTAVTMTDRLQFDPDRLTVPAGTIVQWRNTSAVSHTVTAVPTRARSATDVQLPAGVEPFGSETLAPEQAFTHQLTVAGEYRYVCSIHDESGMVGIIIVQ